MEVFGRVCDAGELTVTLITGCSRQSWWLGGEGHQEESWRRRYEEAGYGKAAGQGNGLKGTGDN